MAPRTDAAGGQALGPHVVGRRVVVRRVVRGETGPSGGPALTDVLGICTSWADGRCVVQPERGAAVSIPWADIVAGKAVPPRRVTPAQAQRRALALWPDLDVEPLGDWLLRASAASTARRANSVLAFGAAGVPHPVAAVTAWYAARGRRPIACVPADGSEAAAFASAGWVGEDGEGDTLFLLAEVDAARREAPSGLPEVRVSDGVATLGGATGVAAYADGWVGLRGIEVPPTERRRGRGLAVVAALLGWGADQGARTAYLQVRADNEPALALYRRLGFRTHHAYRYLAAPTVGPSMQKASDQALTGVAEPLLHVRTNASSASTT